MSNTYDIPKLFEPSSTHLYEELFGLVAPYVPRRRDQSQQGPRPLEQEREAVPDKQFDTCMFRFVLYILHTQFGAILKRKALVTATSMKHNSPHACDVFMTRPTSWQCSSMYKKTEQ